MNFAELRLIYALSCIGLCLIILLPTLFTLVSFPEAEKFSGMWLLDSNHMTPNDVYSISENKFEKLFVGVGNYMGELEYYSVFVKFRNQFEPLPATIGLPSSLEPIFEYRLFLNNNEFLEKSFVFSFEELTFESDIVRVSMLSINGQNIPVEKILVRDAESNGFYCQLFFELWVYNMTTSNFQFNNRSVGFWLNINEI